VGAIIEYLDHNHNVIRIPKKMYITSQAPKTEFTNDEIT